MIATIGWEAWTTIAIVALLFYALWKNLAGADVLLLAAALVLTSLSLLSDRFPGPGRLAANFGNEGVLTVAVLFVVAAALTETGALGVLTERWLGRPRSILAAQFRLMVPVAAISAFMNNTPLVAVFIPVVQDWCKKTGISPSKLLLPLSYGAILGGVTTLIGTSTNLVVQALLVDAARTDPGVQPFSLFTLTPVGVPIALVGIASVMLLSRWLLPARRTLRAALADTRQYTTEMLVQPGSAIDGLTVEAAGLRHLPGAFLSAVERDGELLAPVRPEQPLRAQDRLVFVGVVESVAELQRIRGLVPAAEDVAEMTATRLNRLLVEAVVSASSPIIGRTIRDAQFRARYDAAVIAVYRDGGRITGKIGDISLQPGDAVLLQAHPEFASRHRNNSDFLLVSPLEGSHPVRHHRAGTALAIIAAMVLAATFENFTDLSVFHAALLAAGAMGLAGCLSAERARKSVDLTIILSIVAALTIGQSIERTGVAGAVGGAITASLHPLGPWAVLGGVYLLTLLFTELVTNNAAVALAFPIARAAAQALSADLTPFAVVVAIAASAGFATPLGYQTHLMVYGPGGYRFSDFARMGVPLDIICMVVTLIVTPLVYPF